MTSSATDARAIVEVYRLLSRLWLREIDAELLSDLRGDQLRSALKQLGTQAPDDSVDECAVQYCRLFVGPRDHLPPVQSVWQRSELQSELTISVRKYADLLSYELSEDLPDHLGVELGLMGHAILLAQANPTVPEYEEIGREFFRRHLTWPTEFLNAVQNRSDAGFYRSIAKITRDFLAMESR